MRSCRGLLAGVALLAACAGDTLDPTPAGSAWSPLEASQAGGTDRVTVLNQNVFPGANVDAVIAALADGDASNDLPALATAIDELVTNDVAARAGGVADQIAKHRPDVVGLNEITTIDVDLTPIGVPLVYHQDFLDLLVQALAARDLNYVVAATVQNIEAQPNPFVSYIDYDVVLVNPDRVTVNSTFSHTFAANIGLVAPGVELKRGWTGIAAVIDGHAVTVLTAHPESGEGAQLEGLRALQATELAGSVAAESPVIMLGDYNDVPGSPLYQVVTGAGFTDLWPALHPGTRGYTAMNGYDLSVQHLPLVKRIDYVWVRGFEGGHRPALGQIALIQDQPSDRVQGPDGPIYISDHAGVVATILLPPGLTD
jgi:endonuclease/exonuclease/phosphatase family metal-dependent hydrolase